MNDSQLDQLLAALPDNVPCGKSLRYDPVFDQIMAARQEDDANLPQGVWETTPKKADWKLIIELGTKVLLTQSKDLQIAACLGEAWIATQGLPGAVDAIRLISGLCTDYWEYVYPLPEDGDMEFRLAPLEWADRVWSEALARRAQLVPLPGSSRGGYTLADWKIALDTELQDDKKKDADAPIAGQARYSDILEQIACLPINDLQVLLQCIEAAHEDLNSLRQTLTGFVGGSAPRFIQTNQKLDAIGDMLRSCTRQHPQHTHSTTLPDTKPTMTTASEQAPDLGILKINGREDAYRKLSQIANYLATIEPHSPVPTLIRRAVTWGHMPFEELMRDLMQNNGEIQRMLLK